MFNSLTKEFFFDKFAVCIDFYVSPAEVIFIDNIFRDNFAILLEFSGHQNALGFNACLLQMNSSIGYVLPHIIAFIVRPFSNLVVHVLSLIDASLVLLLLMEFLSN